MPFKIPEAIKSFTWELSQGGLPVANVIKLGGVRYVEVCPCCSCIHQLPVTHQGDTFEPRCLWREWARPDYQKWVKQHPDAATHRTVQLVELPSVQIVPFTAPDIAPAAKPTRRKKAA